jgi:hypothetical protein
MEFVRKMGKRTVTMNNGEIIEDTKKGEYIYEV